MFLLLLACISRLQYSVGFNDFPSLTIANATMAVVIERGFFERKVVRARYTAYASSGNAYEKKLESFIKAITEAVGSSRTNQQDTTDTVAPVGVEMAIFQDTEVNLARDYTVLLSVASCHETWNLFEGARREKLVHLAITDRDCPRLPMTHGISVPILDPGDELPQIFLDLRIARVLEWRRFNLLHDRIFERDTIGRVLEALSREIPEKSHLGLASEALFSIQSQHYSDDGASSKRLAIMEALRKFPPRRPSDDRFLIIVEHRIVPLVIEAARLLGMLHPESQWLYVVADAAGNSSNSMFDSLGRLLAEGENIAFIHNITDIYRDSKTGVECQAKRMVSALSGALRDALRREFELYESVSEEEFDAVRPTKTERSQEILEHIRTELVYEKDNDDDDDDKESNECDEWIVWKMSTGVTWGNSFGRKNETRPHQLTDVGYWTPGTGPSPRDSLLFPHGKYGFGNKLLPIVTYENPPWQFLTRSKKTGKLEWDGLVFDIVDHLSKKLNFTYRLVETGVSGSMDSAVSSYASSDDASNEKERANRDDKEDRVVQGLAWSGDKVPEAVRQLVNGKTVFMAACASTITEQLRYSLNFTFPISIQTYGLLTWRPKQLSRTLLFTSPYTGQAWGCLAGGIIIIGPILYIVHALSPTRTDNDHSTTVGLGSPGRCLWYIYGALLQQGGMHLPQTDGARLIVGTWWLVVMVLVATYSGSLVAFLTFPKMDESISSVEDLLRRKDELTWSLPAKSFLEEYLTNGAEGSTGSGGKLYDGLLGEGEHPSERHDPSNYESAVERVRQGKHVLVDWTSCLRILARMDTPSLGNDDPGLCHFSIAAEEFLEEPIALLLPSGSPYLSLINRELKRMHETGLIEKWTADRMPVKDQCWEGLSRTNRQVNNHKVDIWDMQGIFFVLFLGYLIALVFLTWEFYAHHRKVKKERKLVQPFLS